MKANGNKPIANRPRSLVTGACGFMGTHMTEVLHAAGHEVIATDQATSIQADDRKRGRFPSVAKALNIPLHASDMRNRSSLEPLTHNLDYVFHIASVFNYSTPWPLLKSVNVDGTCTLVDLLRQNSPGIKRMVLWGAGGVYGLPRHHDSPFTEDLPPAPPNDYLRSKWFQEHLVMEAGRKHQFPFSIMRPTTVYGPRAVYGSGPLLMGPAQMNPVMAPSNFTMAIPFVHVRDVCEAALFLAECAAANGQIFNLNDDSQMTNIEYFRYVAEVTGHRFVSLPPIPFEPLKIMLGGVARVAALLKRLGLPFTSPIEADTIAYLGEDFRYSNEKLKDSGYRLRYPDPRVGIRETLEWYREQGWIRY